MNDFAANIQLVFQNVSELIGPPLGGVFFYIFGFVEGLNLFILINMPLTMFYLVKFMNNQPNEEKNHDIEMKLL